MHTCFKQIICIVLCLFLCVSSFAQWSKKDVEWSEEGLTAGNYRLVKEQKNKNPFHIGAVTGSKPAMDAGVVNVDGKRVLKITLSNHFDFENSWMLKTQIYNASLLKHEQGHFDITEIYTRKMFEQLNNFTFTDNFKNEIYTIMQAENNELKQQEGIYEQETVYGSNAEGQEKWNKKIADELAALPSYKDQIIQKAIPDNK